MFEMGAGQLIYMGAEQFQTEVETGQLIEVEPGQLFEM